MKSHFNRFLSFGTVIIMAVQMTSGEQKGDPVDYVNPFIGTDFFGHTFPGASLPYAMVHLSPDMNAQGWTFASGYAYSENSIMGFSHLHWSGVGMVNGGEILIMPTVGDKLQVVPGPLDNPDAGYRSRFDHSSESASPGYYSVFLKDYKVKAELTSTRRSGFHRYTFPESNSSKIILDLGNYAGDAWKTQQRVRQVCEELYRTGPGGLCGNEDMGSFSSWYVLSSMGIYPVTPGSITYAIGSPLFGKVTINSGNGKTFIIEAQNNSAKNKYIQSASLNGKSMTRTWLSQKEITDGGIIIFEMGPEPNKKWGSKPEDAPPSMSKKEN